MGQWGLGWWVGGDGAGGALQASRAPDTVAAPQVPAEAV